MDDDDVIDLSFTADPAYSEECDRLIGEFVAEGPQEWWHLSEANLAALLEAYMEKHGTGPEVLTKLTAVWLTWHRANGYAITRQFPFGPSESGSN